MSNHRSAATFDSESALVTAFSGRLESGEFLRELKAILHEFDYHSGRADVVGVCSKSHVHAYEAKLHNWKVALHQARRNTCFAHYTYVVLPEKKARLMLGKRVDFEKFGVGLIVVSGSKNRVAIRAQKHEPLMPWLTIQVRESALATHNANSSPPANS